MALVLVIVLVVFAVNLNQFKKKILSPLERELKFQQNYYSVTAYTLNVLLHYLI